MSKTILSASQFSTFECLRRGALEYCYGMKSLPTPSMALGSRVHSLAEKYLKTGEKPDFDEVMVIGGKTFLPGQILDPGLEFCPPPGTCIVEGDISFETEHSAWRGARDFIYTPDESRPVANGHVVVGDFKTTSDFKHMKDLTVDVQANLYSFELFEQGAQRVSAQWIYLRTKGRPAAKQTLLTMNQEQVYRRVSEIDSRAEIIHLIKDAKPSVYDVPHNTSRCDDFGGCRFRNRECKIPVTELFSQKPEVSMTSILERLRANKSQALPLETKLQLNENDQFGEYKYEPLPTEDWMVPGDGPGALYGAPEAGFINPPATEPYVGAEAPATTKPSFEVLGSLDAMDRDALKRLCIQHGLATESSKNGAEGFRRLLRANGFGDGRLLVEKVEDIRDKTLEESAETCAAQEPGPFVPEEYNEYPIAILYVHCLPSDRTLTDATTIISRVLPKVLEAAGEAHPKLVPFGKGTALLAAAVEQELRTESGLEIFADRFMDADVLQVLVRLSSVVIRGL